MTSTITVPTAAVQPSRSWTCILLDLDGTIMDSAPGITERLAKTLADLGRPIPTPSELVAWVGPPILDSFRDFAGMTEAQSREALSVYRGHAAIDGPYDGSAVYPGMAGLIEQIQRAGIPLALATSKSESQATIILEHFDLARYFTVICGASEDEVRSAKPDIVAEALRRLDELDIDISHPVMVGDRGYDVRGAAEHDIPAIMVEWGYGSPAEAAGTIAIVHSADQLRSLLLG